MSSRFLLRPSRRHREGFSGTRDAMAAVIAFIGISGALAANSWWGFIFCLLFGIFETREAYLKRVVGNWP